MFDRVLESKVAVSDTARFTSSSASISCFDPDHGMIYSVYHASRRNYGEARDVLALAEIPVAQPHRARTHIIVESGDTVDGELYQDMIDGNILFLRDPETSWVAKTHFHETAVIQKGFVRVLFLNRGDRYCYVDFDPETRRFSPIRPVRCLLDGEEMALDDRAYRLCLERRGMRGFDLGYEPTERLIATTKMPFRDGWYYGFITAGRAQPAAYRTRDGRVLEFLGCIDKLGRYETQAAIVSGRLVALIRGAEGDNLYASDDMGRVFRPLGRLDFHDTRPQLMEYHGKLLAAVSSAGVKPNLARDGRNNMRLLLGSGDSAGDFRELLFLRDIRGLVYYDLIDYKDTLYMIWSNGNLYIDKNPQAKDLLYFARIGDLFHERPDLFEA